MVATGGRTTSRRPGAALRLADAGLAILVVVVVALMVVPLPTWLLDALLSLNLAGSVAVLIAALYVGNALQISAFPTLLLVTTLVRIALHVATTRLILLQADAGQVIRAFGQIVVAGNLVVGAVVFGILTIVQWVVVAKGSERVAEVGARFSLDALPGKQLAIDADLRAGTIDPEGAARKRRALERESQFYGAMDGAVKFVKGDVVATVLIALVNLVGGVAIGVGQRGLDLGASVQLYGLLTIGDGLVTQIPALLMATAAGLLVTRVASEDPRTALGTELATQLLSVPRALGVAGALVLGLALVPGLPVLPFAVVGVGLLVAYGGSRRRAARAGDGADGYAATTDADDDDDGAGPAFVPVVVPWSLELGARVLAEVRRSGGSGGSGGDVTGPARRLRRQIFRDYGVPLPPCHTVRGTDVGDDEARLLVHELPAGTLPLSRDLVGPDLVAALERGLLRALTPRLADLLGITETRRLVDELEARTPALVRQVIPKVVDVTLLTDVLRRLVAEGVSVRDLRAILEAIARSPAESRDATALAEHVRAELRRPLTHSLTGGASELEVIVLDPGLEEAIRSAASRSAPGGPLHLSPAAARDIVGAIRRATDDAAPAPPGPDGTRAQLATVIVTRPDIRRFVKKLVETDLPEVRVVASTELLPELVLRTRGRATLVGL